MLGHERLQEGGRRIISYFHSNVMLSSLVTPFIKLLRASFSAIYRSMAVLMSQ